MKILESTYGYDMTINTYYVVLSENGKTAMVQKVGRTVTNDNGMGSGKSIADPSKVEGEPFRAYIRKGYDGRTIYVSKYIAGGDADIWDGQPSYYNTWD